jgi:adenylate cyclase
VRITGQLIEATTGAHLWAEKIDGALKDVFDLQDEVTTRVVGALEPSITSAEINRAQAKATSNLDAYDLYLKALSVHYSLTRADLDEAIKLLEQAITIDPTYSWAKAFAAYIHIGRMSQGWARSEELEEARVFARDALLSSRDDPNTLGCAAHANAWLTREYDISITAMDRSLELNPNSANILMRSGHLRTWVADADLAINHLLRAIRLSPIDPQIGYHYAGLCISYIIKGDYKSALNHGRRAAQEMPRWVPCWNIVATSAALAGYLEEARAAVRQIQALSPEYSIAVRTANSAFRDKWVNDRFAEGLRVAGLPEG